MSETTNIFEQRAKKLRLTAIALIQEKHRGTPIKLDDMGDFQDMITLRSLVASLRSDWLIRIEPRISLLSYLNELSTDFRDFNDVDNLPSKVEQQHGYAHMYLSKSLGVFKDLKISKI